MKLRITQIALALSLALSFSLQAAETGPVVQVFSCDFKDGKGIPDLRAATEFFNEQLDALQAEADQPAPFMAAVLTPFRANPGNDFYMIGRSPNLNAMAQGGYTYLTSEQGQAAQARFDEVGDCTSGILASEQLLDAMPDPEEGDVNALVETYACTLNAGTTMADVQQAEANWIAAATAQGAEIDVVRWTPMFANTPADMFYLVINDGLREWGNFRTTFTTSEAGSAADQGFQEITNCESGLMIGTMVRAPQAAE